MSASMFTRALMQQPPRTTRATSPQQQQQAAMQAQAAQQAAAAAAAAASSPPSDFDVESELVPFQRFLTELSSPHSSPPAHREEQLFSFFTQLRVSSSPAQIRALDLLAQLLERKPSVILGCTNLLSLIIRILQSSQLKHDHEVSEAETTIVCKLFFLLSSAASEHMTVRDLKRLFRILRRVVERKSPPLLCRLMLSSLADMASSSSAAGHACYVSPTANQSLPLPRPPSRCFDFSGTQSALALPPLEKWPCPKGYTVCMWIRWEAEAKAPALPQKMGTVPGSSQKLPIAQPIQPRSGGAGSSSSSGVAPPAQLAHLQAVPPLVYLYSFLTDKARGIELLVHKHTGAVVVRSVSKGVLQELNTEVRLSDKKWCFLSVCHKKPQTFSRSSGSLSVTLNDECKFEGELSYPQLTEALIFNAFGAATHPSKPSLPFQGRFSTISFHTKPLSALQIQLLYRRGADFCIKVLNQIDRSNKLLSFVSNSITSILGAISSAATTITHSAAQNGDEDAEPDASPESNSGKRHAAEANRELFKNLLGLWHPQCVEGHLALDLAAASGAHLPCHASILPGVQLCMSRDIRDLIHLAVGGITCFFPLFQHLDVLSPAAMGSAAAGKIKSTMHARSGSSAPNAPSSSAEPASPTRLRSQSSILPLLFRTLQLMLRDSPSNQLTFLQCSGFQVISHLLLKYTSIYHLSESLLVALEQIVQELSWGSSYAKLQAASNTDEHANALTLEALTAAASSSAPAAAHPQRKIDLLHTNHHLPVSRAAEKTLYNDAFLHILFNFGLWFRSPTASMHHGDHAASPSAAIDNLLQQQVPFVVQFECLMLIKSHVLKNPRYFRRLLSAGGGGGAVANAAAAAAANGSGANALSHYTHVGAASAGPVKFILDSMRRFLNYQSVFDSYAHASATLAQSAAGANDGTSSLFHPYLAAEVATAVRHLRSLRLEWFGVLRTLMLCPVNNEPANVAGTSSPVLSTAPVVRESDISALVQLICEVSESSASSLSSSDANASSSSSSSFSSSSSPAPPLSSSSISLSAHSWILSEYVSFLTSILLRRPDEVLPILLKLGGCQLFVCILARNVKYQHVQLSVIHLLSSIVKHAMAADSSNARSDFSAQLAGVLSSLQVALAECYLTLPTYGALLELMCGLSPGSLMSAPKDGAEYAIEHFCTTAQRMAGGQQAQSQQSFDESFVHAPSSPAGPPHVPSFSASPPPESAFSSSSSSSSSATSASVFRSCVIKLPRGLELLHALVQNNDLLRMRERRKMKERWHQETVRRSQMQQQEEVEREEHADASVSSASAPVPVAHRSSDNIHYDEDESISSEQSLPVIAPFSFYHPSCNPSLHSAAFPVLAPAPLLSFSHLLSDVEMLIFHQPVNAHTLLTKWPVGIAVFMKFLAWRREEPAKAQAPEPSPEQPSAVSAEPVSEPDAASSEVAASSAAPLDSTAHATAEEQAIANKLRAVGGMQWSDDMDSLLSPSLAAEPASHGSIDDFVINNNPTPTRSGPLRSPVAAPHNDLYLQALFKQQLLADVDLDSDASSSLPLPLIASRIVEALLFYALINMKDGWVQWRGAMLLLRLEAEQQQQSQEQEDESKGKLPRTATDKGGFSEESFRNVRRNLLISLFQRLEQCPAGAAVAPTAVGPSGSHLILHFNLTHIVEMLEEMLYFDASRFTQIGYTMVDSDGNDSAEAAMLRKPSATRSAAASTTQGGGQEWVLFDNDDSDSASGSARSHSRQGSSADARAGSPVVMAPAFFLAEWALVRELLQSLVHVQFSLQPMRFNYAPSASSTALMASAFSPEPNDLAVAPGVPSTDASSLLATPDESNVPLSSSVNAANQFRTGGPLRIVIRLLLDCCSAVCFSPELQSSSDESLLTQLQDIVSQLGALVHVELASASFTTASGQKHASSANREWKNRHVVHILWRLCQIMQALPVAPPRPASSEPVPIPADQMRRILHSTINQIVESLKPFAAVSVACFEPPEAAPPQSPAAVAAAAAAAEKIVSVPLEVNDEGMLVMDPAFEWTRVASMGSGGQNVAAIDWNTDSPTAPRVSRACAEYIASSVQLWRSMERKFAAEFVPENETREITMRRRLKESGLLESGSQRLFNAMDVQRNAWRTVQTCSYAEVNRRAVADTFYSEHVHRVSEQWRALAHQLYSEGSAWCSSEIALRRKFWQIDTVEDGYRMRRKLKVCLEGVDHHQASQAYIDNARTIAAAREKADRERAKKEAQRRALLPPSTPAPKHTPPPAGTLHASISSPALSLSRPVTPLPPNREIAADSPENTARADVSSPSLDESKELDVSASASSVTASEPDASVEADRLQQLASSLGSSLKRVGEEDEPDEPDEKDDSETVGDARGRSEDMEVDRLTGLQQRKSTKSDKEEANASNVAAAAAAAAASGEDWDIVDSASTPLSSASSGAASSASFNPSAGSLYTSPMCTLVLPIGIVYGTLEISAHSLKFVHNPHAEQQLLQQQLIAAEAAARQYAKEGHLRPYAPPPPKSKPFTLPSLDAWRARSKKDRVWPLSSIVAVYRRRYQLQKTALEVFLLNGRNYFVDFGTRAERKTVLRKILALRPPRLIRLCSRSVSELLARSRLTEKWVSRELSSFEYLMHINTCLSSSTLVATADGRNVRADDLTLQMQLFAPNGDAIAIESLTPGVSPWMLRIVTEHGQHTVTPNHLVTLRFARNPGVHIAVHKDEAGLIADAYIKMHWWCARTLERMQIWWRFNVTKTMATSSKQYQGFESLEAAVAHCPQKCAIVPSSLSGREAEFCHWWLQRAEKNGEIFPLHRGDLLEIRADVLAKMHETRSPILEFLTIPMARLNHPRVSSIAETADDGAAAQGAASSDSARDSSVMVDDEPQPIGCARAREDTEWKQKAARSAASLPSSFPLAPQLDAGDLDQLAVQFLAEIPAGQKVDAMEDVDDESGDDTAAASSSAAAASSADEPVYPRVVQLVSVAGAGETVPAGVVASMRPSQQAVVTGLETVQRIGSGAAVNLQYSIMALRMSSVSDFGYRAVAVGDDADVVYMLQNPVVPTSTLNNRGKKAYTFLQLEHAWQCLRINPTEEKIMILNPICSLTDEIDSTQLDFAAVCRDTMAAAMMASNPSPSRIVVFGGSSQSQWRDTGFVSSIPGVRLVGPMRQDFDTEVWWREVQTARGDTIKLLFAPHPSEGWLFSDMLAAIAMAHGVSFDPEVWHNANPTARIQRIEPVAGGAYMAIKVRSKDARFVLSDFLITHNCSGRTYNDLSQYPVFPWVIAHYPEPKVKLVPVAGGSQANLSGSATTPVSVRAVEVKEEDSIDVLEVIRAGPSHPDTARVFRDLRKPMGALDPARLEQVLERFNTFFDSSIPPFHYGSHYSNAAIVLFYLMRLEPYSSLHVELQSGKFDWPDRLFSSMASTWKNCCTSLSCYKELTPEFYYDPSPFENINGYDLGTKQDGQIVEDVALPTWAHDSAAEFVRINRLALESEYVSENLHHWIDLIFGFKQKGQAAKDACNLFFHLTYEGAVDIATVKDPVLLDAIKEQIAQFGQTPVQLFKKPHPQRQPLAQAKRQRLTLSSTLAMMLEQSDYHHPRLRCMLVSKDQPVLSIRAFPTKLFSISANFVLGLHLWQPDVSSEVEEMGAAPGSNHVQIARRYALPFTHALAHVTQLPKHNPVIGDACSFTLDGRLLLEGNDWTNGLRVYQASSSVHFDALKHRERGLGSMGPAQPNFGDLKLTLSQNLIQHRDRITCLALGKDEKTLVTGSKDCTLLVWSLEVEDTSRVTGIFKEGELFVRPTPKWILRGHEEPVIAVAVESELDVAVSISARGQVMMHSVRKGSFLMHLQVPRVHEVQARLQEAHAKTIANATAAAVAANHGGVAPIPAAASSAASSSPTVSFSVPPSTHLASGLGADSLLGRSRTGSSADSPVTQLHLAKLVQFACDGCLVFYSVVWDSLQKRFQSPQVSKCTLNGRHWVAVAIEEYLQCITISGDGKLIATGSEDGMLVLRRLHDLKVVQRFEPVMSSITSLAFSFDQDYLFVGTSSGHMVIYAVKC